jgi:hypothetical protein
MPSGTGLMRWVGSDELEPLSSIEGKENATS